MGRFSWGDEVLKPREDTMSMTTPSRRREISLRREQNRAMADLRSSSEFVPPQVIHAAVTGKKRGLDLIGLNLASSCAAPLAISRPLMPHQSVGGTFKSKKQQQPSNTVQGANQGGASPSQRADR